MDASHLHCTSLPDDCPLPIITLTVPDARLAPNPAALAMFPDLLTVGLAHPAVQALPALAAQMHATGVPVVTHDVQVGATQCHQILLALPDRQAIRVYLLDATPHATQLDAIGRLAGGVAHHVNNLLAVMLGYAGLLEEDLPPDTAAMDKVRAIQQAGERTAALVRQLVAFSRQTRLEPQIMALNTVIRTLATRLCPLLGPAIGVTTILDPHLGWVEADPHQLGQALMYLVDNAREAMLTGGHLMLETRNVELDRRDTPTPGGMLPGPYVVVTVRDTGCGMDATTQAQMWEPFFTTKPVGQGIGLSLAMVYGTITQSGGHVTVRSAVGEGTTVTVYLPRLQPDVQRPPVESGTLRLPRGTETIVLVEAEPRDRTWARRTLEVCGYTVLDAGTGAEALDLVEHAGQPVHVLVTEVALPDMRGPQLAAHVLARYAAVQVLYLVDAPDEVEAHGLGDAGVVVLQKPVAPAVIVRKVREVLDNEGG